MGKVKKKVDWIPKSYTAVDFLKVTRQLFGMSLLETKLLYDFLLEQYKRKEAFDMGGKKKKDKNNVCPRCGEWCDEDIGLCPSCVMSDRDNDRDTY